MLKLTIGMLVALGPLAAGAQAQGLQSMQLANDLGSVLASEAACGLSFNQTAIETFIVENVAAEDMGFASTLNTMIVGNEFQLASMSTSAKTAHCAQIRRVAKSYGFID